MCPFIFKLQIYLDLLKQFYLVVTILPFLCFFFCPSLNKLHTFSHLISPLLGNLMLYFYFSGHCGISFWILTYQNLTVINMFTPFLNAKSLEHLQHSWLTFLTYILLSHIIIISFLFSSTKHYYCCFNENQYLFKFNYTSPIFFGETPSTWHYFPFV